MQTATYDASTGHTIGSTGFSSALTNLVDRSLATVPRVSLGAYSTISPWESGDGTNSSLTHVLQTHFTRLQGTHNLKFGVDSRIYRAFGNRFPRQTAPDLSSPSSASTSTMTSSSAVRSR
ncbi:MAG: hypothetical protein FJW20_10950 [Acidimicrobiia bacterium]|nr:hypothetical protein [Acidimicrobiia bacterium]